jgi:tetratricopeptide (TPR) repeat protein
MAGTVSPLQRRLLAAFTLEAAYHAAHNQGTSHLPRARGDLRDQPTYVEALVELSDGYVGAASTSSASMTLWIAFKERWFHAAIAVLERAQLASSLERRVDQALAVFPAQPRFVLAHAMVAEIRTSPYGGVSESDAQPRFRNAIARFADVGAVPEVKQEASVRLGFLELRSGDAVRALREFERIEPQLDDPFLKYLARLFRGRSLSELNRDAEAEASFRSALDLMPEAQSAQLALAITRVDQNDPAGANNLADVVLKRPAAAPDPWWSYWIGDARLWPEIVQALRREIR